MAACSAASASSSASRRVDLRGAPPGGRPVPRRRRGDHRASTRARDEVISFAAVPVEAGPRASRPRRWRGWSGPTQPPAPASVEIHGLRAADLAAAPRRPRRLRPLVRPRWRAHPGGPRGLGRAGVPAPHLRRARLRLAAADGRHGAALAAAVHRARRGRPGHGVRSRPSPRRSACPRTGRTWPRAMR